MKSLILLVATLALSSQFANGQKSPTAKGSKAAAQSTKWQSVNFKKWGVNGLTLPSYLVGKAESPSKSKSGEITTTTVSKVWNSSAAKKGAKVISVDLDVTNWDKPFPQVVKDVKPEEATPQNLLAVNLLADMKNQQEENSRVEFANFYDVDGVGGGMTRFRDFSVKDQVIIVWQTYRYFKGQSQRITLTVTFLRPELENAEKIVNSLMLEKEPAEPMK